METVILDSSRVLQARPLRVAVLGTRGFPGVQGGVEAHCQNLYERLADKGCSVVVFTRRPYINNPRDFYKKVRLVHLFSFRNKTLEALLHTLNGLLHAIVFRPDIVHIHGIGPSFLAPLAKLMGLRVVVTHHGPDYMRKKWGVPAKAFLRLCEYIAVKTADRMICVCQPIAEHIRNKYGRCADIIPNGVNEPCLNSAGEVLERYSLSQGKYFLAVGRLVPEKGFDTLIEAFVLLKNTNPAFEEWKLVIAGGADHKDSWSNKLKRTAKSHTCIVLTGALNSMLLSELYSRCGLYILPSLYEGFPISLLEAMSYGISCVASDISGNRASGLAQERLFRPGNVQELARKMAEFACGMPYVQAQDQARLVSTRYNWDSIAERTFEVYTGMLVHDN